MRELRPSQPTASGSPTEASPSVSGVNPGTRLLLQCQTSALIWLNLLLTWNICGCSHGKPHLAISLAVSADATTWSSLRSRTSAVRQP